MTVAIIMKILNIAQKLKYSPLLMVLLFYTVSGYAAPLLAIKNLNKILLDQQTPAGGSDRPQFYANGVELEPFTIHLCGLSTIDPDDPTRTVYHNVDPSEVYKVQFFVKQADGMDSRYNPNNFIPIMHETKPLSSLEKAASMPDEGEPDISQETSEHLKILRIYDQTSNYYKLYSKIEGLHLGGVASRRSQQMQLQNFPEKKQNEIPGNSASGNRKLGGYSDANSCYPGEPLGMGDTVVHLYLLATPGLNKTINMHITAHARADTPGHPQYQQDISYDVMSMPIYDKSNMVISKFDIPYHLKHIDTSYGYFSSMIDNSKRKVRLERSYPVCKIQMGAPFHNLYRYADHTDDGKICGAAYKTGQIDCNAPSSSCSRRITITAITSKSIPFHDMFTSFIKVGAKCPHQVAAYKAYATFKPLLNSFSEKASGDDAHFYTSYTGGVGSYYFPSENTSISNEEDNTKNYVVGGNTNTFYYFSYVTGEKLLFGPGLSCNWETATTISGHDIYGNPINISVIMANGDKNGRPGDNDDTPVAPRGNVFTHSKIINDNS